MYVAGVGDSGVTSGFTGGDDTVGVGTEINIEEIDWEEFQTLISEPIRERNCEWNENWVPSDRVREQETNPTTTGCRTNASGLSWFRVTVQQVEKWAKLERMLHMQTISVDGTSSGWMQYYSTLGK
uniref:Uncharacterized protein n=1 Tax=Vespula pensylvanica TaxID=30213 RepID=A0A834UG62_VESPE|nr:hypothetical protein H0235_000153 [Vespula pensylvanica]